MIKYSENGFWIEKLETEYRIGLSDKGQDDLGDIGFLEILETTQLSVDDAFIGVEASKAVTELTAPVNGVVTRVNERLEKEPELLNSTNPEDNWIVCVRDVSESEWNTLLSESGFVKESE